MSTHKLAGKESSTNELPLTALQLPMSPEIMITDSSGRLMKRRMSQSYNNILDLMKLTEFDPLGTNDRPLSCTCSVDQLYYENCLNTPLNLSAFPSEVDFPTIPERPNWKNSNFFKKNYKDPLISLSLDSFDRILMLDDNIQHLVNKTDLELDDQNKTGSFLYDVNNNNNANNGNSIINTSQSLLMSPHSNPQPSSSSSCAAVVGQIPISVEYLIPTIQSTYTCRLRGNRRMLRKTKSTDDDDGPAGFTIQNETVMVDNSKSSPSLATQNVYFNNKTHYPIIKITKKSHLNNKNPDSATSHSNIRRHRHSLGGNQMSSCFKMLTGNCGKNNKMTTSTNSLFSTAVISGSSSAPNLRDMIPNTASPSGNSIILLCL